jgi:hypothetical protein
LRWKFEAGAQHFYKFTEKMQLSMDVPGLGKTEMTFDQTVDVTWQIKDVNADGVAQISQSIDRVQMKIDAPGQTAQYDTASDEPPQGMATMLAPSLKALTAGPTEMTMTPRGTVTDIKIDPEVVKAMRSVPGAAANNDTSEEGLKNIAMQVSIELPETLNVGDQWRSDLEMSSAMAGGKVGAERTYTYAGAKEVDGKTLEVITPSIVLKFGDGQDDAQPLKVDNQKTTGEILFNRAAGLLQSSELEQDMDIVVTGPGGESMAQKMVQTIKLMLVENHDAVE